MKDIDILSSNDIINMIEDMAGEGHAPVDGCSLFGIGNDESIEIIKKTYFERRFKRGASSEKFIVGPFGSGKTHFSNQLSEIARQMGCVTSTVSLNKNIDVTSNYAIYKEIIQQIRPPHSKKQGALSLLYACFEKIRNKTLEQTDSEKDANYLLKHWIDSLEIEYPFRSDIFGRIAKQAFDAILKKDAEKIDLISRWMSGEFQNRDIAKQLGIQKYAKAELNNLASKVNLSLYQLIRKSGYLGTVVVFDEAEQGFEISRKKKGILYSLMMSDINSIVNLESGSVLVLYAIVPSIKEGMMDFPALQQRVQHPIPFGKNNPRAPLIEIKRSGDTKEEVIRELNAIGKKLTDLMYQAAGNQITIDKKQISKSINQLSTMVTSQDISLSSRRMMVKATCTFLMYLYDNNEIMDLSDFSFKEDVPDELDDEV